MKTSVYYNTFYSNVYSLRFNNIKGLQDKVDSNRNLSTKDYTCHKKIQINK